jgi:hypothetical protein
MNRVRQRNPQRHHVGAARGGIAPASDYALDLDRTASMADEGGCAGAKMDLRDQLADTRVVQRYRPSRPATTSLLWGVAGLAVGLLAALMWRQSSRAA